MAVVIEKRVLGGVVRIGRDRKWMPDFRRGIFGEYVGTGGHGRDVCAVMAGNTILFVLTAQQPRRPAGVVWRMIGDASGGGHSGVTADESVGRNLAGGQGMRAGGPVDQRIDLLAYLPSWIVAGQTHLAVGTVSDQEIWRYQISGLHVRIVTRRALDVS